MDYNNIWFYTLSTSAQVLAALAGLFAVFVVWKIQNVEKSLFEIRFGIIRLVSNISSNTKGYTKISLEDLHSFSDLEILKIFSDLLYIKTKEPERIGHSETLTTDNLVSYSLDQFTNNTYENLIKKKNDILKELKKILIINFSVISICVFALTISDIVCYKQLALFIISLVVLYCLYIISKGIYDITKH